MSLPIWVHPVSRDGVGAIGPDRKPVLYPLEGGEPRAIPGAEPGDVPVRFSSDSRSLFVYRRPALPARLYRIDLATGRRSLWKEVAPSDPAGLVSEVSRFLPTPDGRFYVYGATRLLSELYVAEGLR